LYINILFWYFFFFLKKLANLVLQNTLERIIVNDCYGEKERGVFIIRGENVVLLGEIVCFFVNEFNNLFYIIFYSIIFLNLIFEMHIYNFLYKI